MSIYIFTNGLPEQRQPVENKSESYIDRERKRDVGLLLVVVEAGDVESVSRPVCFRFVSFDACYQRKFVQ